MDSAGGPALATATATATATAPTLDRVACSTSRTPQTLRLKLLTLMTIALCNRTNLALSVSASR